MLSGRLLLLMEGFVRARNPEVHSRPSRERPLYMGGPFFLRMHYISLVKFTLRTTEAGQTLGFVNCTRWPTWEECWNEFGPETWWNILDLRCYICDHPWNINTARLTRKESHEKVSFAARSRPSQLRSPIRYSLGAELRTWEIVWRKYRLIPWQME